MVDIRLIEYIRKYSSEGYSNQQIGETLLQNGYSQDIIREAFAEITNTNQAPIQNSQPVNPTNIYQQGQNPYPQNYNQYDYHDNSSSNSNTNNTKQNKTVSLKVAMIAIVVLLLILGGIYMLISKDSPDPVTPGGSSSYDDPVIIDETDDTIENQEEDKETNVQLAELNGDEEFSISLCSEIKSDYSCQVREDSKYASDESISYVHIYKAKTVEVNGGYRIGYSVKREVYDSSGDYVARLSSEGFPIIRTYPIETEVENKFGQQIFAKDFETPGKYTLKFIVTDRYTFEEIIKEQNIVII